MQVICYRILRFNIVSHQKYFTYILFYSLSFTSRVITEKYVIIPVTWLIVLAAFSILCPLIPILTT